MRDVVVIGAGLSGLLAAIRLRRAGLAVTMVHKGRGVLQLGQGTIDLLGYRPDRVARPLDELDDFLAVQHRDNDITHPYAHIGVDAIREGAEYLAELLGEGFLMGDPAVNVALPTAIGALRPTALYQPSMAEGVISLDPATPGALHDGSKLVVVGIREFKDFTPELIAGNLERTELPAGGHLQARAAWVSFPARKGEVDSTGLNIARALDDPNRRGALVRQLKKLVEHGETIALPAVLGDEDPGAFADIRRQVGSPLFEIPVPPPSVPGMRLNDELIRHAKRERVEIILGSKVTGADATDGHLDAAVVGTSGHDTHLKARTFLLAAGGFESGTLELDSYQKLSETILGLPLAVPAGELINDTWAGQQPLFRAGVATNDDMVVVDPATGQPVHDNLWAAGGVLAGAQRWDEKTGDGIAVASAVRAADAIISNLAGGQR